MMSRPRIDPNGWKRPPSVKTEPTTTSDLARGIADPENQWDNCRRLPEIAMRPPEPQN